MTAYGYTRISTVHQSADLQRRALIDAGVDERNIYSDVITGASTMADRPGWAELMKVVRPGDQIHCWRIDRVGRSVADVVTTVHRLGQQGINVVSVSDGIDPTTPGGRMLLNLMATLAEYERDLITERVRSGMEAARARGVRFGRPKKDMRSELDKAQLVATLVADGKSVADAGQLVGWSRATSYRRLALLEDVERASA